MGIVVGNMATWQFDLHCLPQRSVLRTFEGIPVKITTDQFNSTGWWGNLEPLPEGFTSAFAKILPVADSWSADIKSWGSSDGNRIDLVSENGQPQDVFVRIDVRKVSYSFVIEIVRIAKENDWLFLSEGGEVLRPAFREVMFAIKRSDAFRFVENPEEFLQELERERKG